MASELRSPLFTRKVVDAMRSLYPEELADKSWDNVGLLQENIEPSTAGSTCTVSSIVLLTNDLTGRVAQEAIAKKASVIITYHPFIFRGFKSVTLADPQQSILLQLAQHNIAVYSPHTAIDATPGGMNDWLADMLDKHGVSTRRSVIKPSPLPVPQGFGGAGFGRLVQFGHPVNIGRIVEAYAYHLGGLRYVMVAVPKQHPTVSADKPGQREFPVNVPPNAIRSVAICAGSGTEVFKGCDADLYVTGEMSHHDALRYTMLGKCVLTVFHSNSERRFLKKRLQPDLLRLLQREDAKAEVLVSEEDEDPFEIWDVKNLPDFAK